MSVNDEPPARFEAAQPSALRPMETFSEVEALSALRTVTSHLFHYTNADAAISHILPSGKLRLSPYESTNDLWESQPHYPMLTTHQDHSGHDSTALWEGFDQHLRLRTKVGCLTQDVALPSAVMNPDALRGWAHLSLWAHYGDGHAGLCLRFDRDQLVASFREMAGPTALTFDGPVRYVVSHLAPATRGLDRGQVAEFGMDAAALFYAETNKDQLFFRKHIDWSSETEYRLVLVNQSRGYEFVDIRSALTGIVLGSAFPQRHVPELMDVLRSYPGIKVRQLRFLNRGLHCFPFEGATPEACPTVVSAWPAAHRKGTLAERLHALRTAEIDAQAKQQVAVDQFQAPVAALERGIEALRSKLSHRPRTRVRSAPGIAAVPPELRARRPGVPGEVIHYQQGFTCEAENLPTRCHALIAAVALQVLADRKLRLHAVVTIENRAPDNNETEELWRAEREVPGSDAEQAVTVLLNDLNSVVLAQAP
ncbi:DUF2971 domain-containing protein [Streptomyces rimosus]|uniref:DUF2971 domain-containing protein n=1 Tax=Streptomyces rimosus TaxID=1927 RepID=UPI00379D3E20